MFKNLEMFDEVFRLSLSVLPCCWSFNLHHYAFWC